MVLDEAVVVVEVLGTPDEVVVVVEVLGGAC